MDRKLITLASDCSCPWLRIDLGPGLCAQRRCAIELEVVALEISQSSTVFIKRMRVVVAVKVLSLGSTRSQGEGKGSLPGLDPKPSSLRVTQGLDTPRH
jgi:hypothetical protein